jgi:hypothetical protein
MIRKLALTVAVVALSSPFVTRADRMAKNSDETTRASMGETKDQTRFRNLVNEAAEAYGSIAKGPHGEVPKSVLSNEVDPKNWTGR